ncbi:MAG: helix-turn-helix transcriptional regulator [Desulfobacterales bacterium]|nr:helix-turn-helix transcriptional regulator [Desulfobacterales bacterium]MDJ0886259.1 helix-turn-helix transcriptional regulator [Desulfobacterales bacterium]
MDYMLSTKEVARFIGVNEKMVYTLVADKGLPATKITGKWLFPRHLVEQWIEANTINYPEPRRDLPPYEGILILAGSNDPLLEKAISLFNRVHPEHLAVFGNLGSLGGLRALRRRMCHVAGSHLLQEEDDEYNFDFAARELEHAPAVVNFCRREQGILVAAGNPRGIGSVADLATRGLRLVNRPNTTGTRLLLDRELQKAGIDATAIDGYHDEVARHLDLGLEIAAGRADAGPGIRAVAGMLGLDFIPLRWERYDLLVTKERFFDPGVQLFLGLLTEKTFRRLAETLEGYDVRLSGKMVFPAESA